MKTLLLVLALLWTVHSWRRLKIPDYEICKSNTKEYFCLVTPSFVQQTSADKLIVPVTDKLLRPAEIQFGIMIKPLTPQKWLVIMHSQFPDLIVDEGIFIFKERNNHRSADFPPKDAIAGCTRKGAMYSHESDSFMFQVLLDDSVFKQNEMIKCVGILSSKSSKPITSILQVGDLHQIILFYTRQQPGDRAQNYKEFKALKIHSTVNENVDFSKLDQLVHCDFDMLKPPPHELVQTHYFQQVATYSDTIDCSKANLFEDSTSTLDLLIKPVNSEFIVANKITCEDKILYYHTEQKKTKIEGDAIVACGERPKCRKPATIECTKSDKCTAPEMKGECNEDKSACDKIECRRQWLINGKTLYTGNLQCRKESVEDFSDAYWYAEINNKKVRVVNGTCQNTIHCQVKNPVVSKCDLVKEGCSWATFVRSKIYCPKNYDLKFKEKAGGKEYNVMKEYGALHCDLESGEWNMTGTSAENEDVQVKIVYCMFNASRDNVLLGGKPLTFEEDNKWYVDNLIYFYLANGAVIVIDILIFALIKLYDHIQDRKEREEAERLKDVRRWTREERWTRRPINRHPNDFVLSYTNLRNKDAKALCHGFWRDFNLYAPEERFMFLESCLRDMGQKESYVHLMIPLMLKCTEKDELDVNEKQPLHPKIVGIAFKIMKVICATFSCRGDVESADRIKAVIGIRAANITFDLGLERREGEDIEQTQIRIHAIEALLFAGHKETENRLIQMWDSTDRELTGTPLIKYVYAVAVKREPKNFEIVRRMLKHEQENGAKGIGHHGNARWGDKIEHLVFALCAGPDQKLTEKFLNDIVKDPFYTATYILAAFQSMFEIFDYNRMLARFIYMGRINFIRKKMPPRTPEYLTLFRMLYTYVIYFPNRDHWLMDCLLNCEFFDSDERREYVPEMNIAGFYSNTYTELPKTTGIVEHMERWLSKVEFIKQDERERLPIKDLSESEVEYNAKSWHSWQDERRKPSAPYETGSERRFKKKMKEAEEAKKKQEEKEKNKPTAANFMDFVEDGDKKMEMNTGREKSEEKKVEEKKDEVKKVDEKKDEGKAASLKEEKTALDESGSAKKEEEKASASGPTSSGGAKPEAQEAVTQEEKSAAQKNSSLEEKTQNSA